MTRMIPLVFFLFFASIAVVALWHEKPVAQHTKSYALPVLDMPALHDTTRRFTTESGVMVLNFFASWCLPCLEEHQELLALKKAFPHVRMHGIVWNDTAPNIHEMLRKHGNPYDALWFDEAGRSAISLGLRGIPETFIVKEGIVIYHISGAITPAIRKQQLEVILAR